MKLLNFAIIKLTFFLVVGILFAHHLNIEFRIQLLITISLVVVIGVYTFFLRSKLNKNPLFGILTCLSMLAVGMVCYNLQHEKLKPNHYTYISSSSDASIRLKVREHLKPDAYNSKYIMCIESYNSHIVTGKVLVNIKHDSLSDPFAIDDIIYTQGKLENIQKPLNPYQFDYSKYLELKGVYHQLYLENQFIIKESSTITSIYGYADQIRNHINTKLTEAKFSKDVLAIMNALLLGQRQSIDKTVYATYVNSGTIHILAVSGLHVGILLLILQALFKPIRYLKYGHLISGVSILVLLWLFAIIAGLSPSVTRAVAMFSIISIAMHLKRPTNIYNTLVISAFIILLFKPMYLFEVGFQMSYLAVLGIVSVQPIIYRLWKPEYILIDKFWQIFTVTLAAQAGVVPISLFYFHQFPGLFFISNLVVIPFLGLILSLGLLVIILAVLNILPDFIITVYSFIIESLNGFIAWVANFEDFLIRDISFSGLQVVFSYVVIVALVQLYKYRTYRWLALSLIAIISFQAVSFYPTFKSSKNSFIVFNKSRKTLIGLKRNNEFIAHHNLDSATLRSDMVLKNYKIGETIDKITHDSLQNVYMYDQKIILVIDSMLVYENLSFKPNYILLRNSPKLNLNRIIDSLQPQYIIADASNYKSYIKRWHSTCNDKKIPFHQTNEKGAFILH